MANFEEYEASAKLVRELGNYCAKYGLTKADLEPVVHAKLMKEQKEWEEKMANRDRTSRASREGLSQDV